MTDPVLVVALVVFIVVAAWALTKRNWMVALLAAGLILLIVNDPAFSPR